MFTQKNLKKILITGGAGFIGNELIKSLPKNLEIVVVDNFHIDTPFKRAINKKLQKERKLTLINANVSEVKKYRQHIQDVDILVYMASLNSYKEANANPLLYIQENNIALQTLLDTLKETSPKLKKIILTSTRGVYGEGPYRCNNCKKRFYPSLSEKIICTFCASGKVTPQKIKESDQVNPSSYYGVTKKIQEDLIAMYALQNNVLLDIFRIFNVYGEGQGNYYSHIGIIPQIFKQITEKKEMYLAGSGTLTRDFVYAGDIVKILSESIYNKNTRKNQLEIYNLGSGNPTSIEDTANFFEKSGYSFKKNYLKPFNDIKYSVADNTKVLAAFNLEVFADINSFLSYMYPQNI